MGKFVYLEHRGPPQIPDCCEVPYVRCEGEAILELGKERRCGEVEVCAHCRGGLMNCPVKQPAALGISVAS